MIAKKNHKKKKKKQRETHARNEERHIPTTRRHSARATEKKEGKDVRWRCASMKLEDR